MSNEPFLSLLTRRKDEARLDFLEAKHQLEIFEQEWGSLVYIGQWEQESQALSDTAAIAYKAYKKAWVEWVAHVSGVSLQRHLGQKDTPAFAAAVPARLRLDLFNIQDDPFT